MQNNQMEVLAVNSLAVAFGFLTTLPVPSRVGQSSVTFGHAFTWFPVVGLVLGVIQASAALGLGLFLPVPIVAALVFTLGVLLTGGLHLDGLMDTCDGLFAARSGEERLAIMRDSHTGAFGVLGAVCLALVKYGALTVLLQRQRDLLLAGVLLAPILSRWAMVWATVGFPYGRTGETLGAIFRQSAGPRQLAAASVYALLLVTIISIVTRLGFWWGIAAFASTAGLTYVLARLALGRLPGLTGDVYGAINEVIEAMVLVTFTAL